MSNPEIPDSPQVKFIHEWAQAIDNKNLDLVAKSMHKDYRHILYPRSLGKPDQTKQEWLERLTEVVGLWTENKLTVHSVIDAPGKVIVHSTNNVKTTVGIDVNRESILIGQIVTDEDGSLKIKQFEEFTDSKAYLDVIEAFAALKAKQQ